MKQPVIIRTLGIGYPCVRKAPNHQPPGSAAPRLVDDLRDIELLARVSRRTQRTRAPSWMPWIIAALGLAVAVYDIAKMQAGAGL